jgi:hypothetical protein
LLQWMRTTKLTGSHKMEAMRVPRAWMRAEAIFQGEGRSIEEWEGNETKWNGWRSSRRCCCHWLLQQTWSRSIWLRITVSFYNVVCASFYHYEDGQLPFGMSQTMGLRIGSLSCRWRSDRKYENIISWELDTDITFVLIGLRQYVKVMIITVKIFYSKLLLNTMP